MARRATGKLENEDQRCIANSNTVLQLPPAARCRWCPSVTDHPEAASGSGNSALSRSFHNEAELRKVFGKMY